MDTGGGSPSAGLVFVTIIQVILSVALYSGYDTFFVGKYAATPGKMALGLMVVRSDGSRLTYWRAFARFWAEILSRITIGIGYIIAGFDDEKRTLHDHICDTRVVKKNF